MPEEHIAHFTVRYYECDAYGHLNNSVYLQYMQEAAIEASNALGFDLAYHTHSNRFWLPRRTEIEYFQSLFPGDRVFVKTWNHSFRRVIGRRIYEFRKEGEDGLIARGFTDWVYVDGTSLTPVKIPTEVAETYNPEFPDIEPLRRDPFPKPPPPPFEVFRYHREVEFRDIDPMKHLNNAAYLTYAEETAMHLSEAFGWPLSKQLENGIAFVARKNQIEYLQPALPGDEIQISTWLYDLKSTSGTRYFKYNQSETHDVLAELHMLWVMVDIVTGKPRRLPVEMRDGIEANLAQTIG